MTTKNQAAAWFFEIGWGCTPRNDKPLQLRRERANWSGPNDGKRVTVISEKLKGAALAPPLADDLTNLVSQ